MKRSFWKPFAWCVVSFIVFAIVAAPALMSMGQKNARLRAELGRVQDRLTAMQQRMDQGHVEYEARVAKAIASKTSEFREESQQLAANLESTTKELETLRKRCEFDRQMQANMNQVQKRLDALRLESFQDSGQDQLALRKRLTELSFRYEQVERALNALRASGVDSNAEGTTDAVRSAWDQLADFLDQTADTDRQVAKTSG